MAILSKDCIALHARAANQAQAIRKAGKLLVNSGCVLPGYVAGMLSRERSMSTSLGNGIAIPHGVYENRNQILKSGISVLQLAEGVNWDKGGKVYLVIAIAVLSDEHVGVLSNLAKIIDHQASLTELFRTTDPDLILNYLDAN